MPPDAYPFPVVEESAFEITILTPKPVRMTERFTEVTYTAPRPLSRAYYRFDNREMVQVTPGAAIPIGRLALGTHTVTVTGVDYYGRYGEGTIVFEVIPLALGETQTVGTAAYPDDAAFSFTGQRVNYTLTFEAEAIAEESVSVFVNRHLTGIPGEGVAVTPSAARNGQVGTIADLRTGWQIYTMPVPDEMVVAGDENLISFIHAGNPSRTASLAEWHVRNVILAPSLQTSAPMIQVFTPDQACGPDEEVMAWVRIAGIAPDDRYVATVCLIAPDGTELPFPGESGEVAPLAADYVTNNHQGRLPGSFVFTDGMENGTYLLKATLTPEESDRLVSLSSVPVYFSSAPSVHLYRNRADLTDGMALRVTGAVTRGEEDRNASLTVFLEPPEGPVRYLPAGTEEYASTRMAPLASEYMLLFDDQITDAWQDGTYTVRARLTGEDGIPLAEDTATFSVSRDDGTLQLVFPGDVRTKTVSGSRIRLTDTATREIVQDQIRDGLHTRVTLTVPAGTYLISGEITTADGSLWIISGSSANRAVVRAGETTVRELSLMPPVAGMIPEVSA